MRYALATTPLAAIDPELEGLRVLVVGLGKSGIAAARLASSRGGHALVVDRRPEPDLAEAAAELRALGIEVRGGGHPVNLAGEADLVVISPGVPGDLPLLDACRELGVPVWGEVELASRFCRGRIVGITGSNGKSTTTSMAGSILRAAGLPGGTGGNLDTPLSDLLVHDGPGAVHAVELSSFQLETVEAFRPAVAVIVNLSPDHLDRYPSYDAYAHAKARLLEVQDRSGIAILNADDPESARFEGSVRGALYRFSTRGEVDRGGFVRDGRLILRTERGEEAILDARELPVPGEHNVANALAAAVACQAAGDCSVEALAEGLRTFRPLAHRLERVGAVGGVSFYNDSKATNVDAASRALASFAPGTVHLILGGKDKGADWDSMADLVRTYARRVLLVGQAAPSIRRSLSGVAPMEDCGTIAEAVGRGLEGAGEGDTVLLSPACASFDQYRSFEERGDDFRRCVAALGGRE
jgi:UDP-N-acetylmuramoylalanine--D-glutamate ligase